MSKRWIPAAAVGTLLGVAAWKEHKTIQGAMGGGQRASTIDTLKIANKNFDDARHAYDAAPTQANHTAMRTAYAARTRAYKADQAVWDKHAALMSRRLGQRAKGGKNIGRTWESYKGTRTVVGTYKDTGKWLVQMEGDTSGRLEVFNTAQLESEIAFDAKQLARHKSLAPEREAKAKAHAAAVAREGAEEADYENTWGYGETLSAMARARAIKALNKQVGFNGRFARRKDEIYRLVTQKGWRTAQQRSWGRVLQSPDGDTFLVQKDLTKTGLDFADYLAAKGQRVKTNYRRKNKARSYRHRDTVRAKLLQDEANTKRRREDRKSASEGRRAKRRKPSKRAREEWMRRYDKLMGSPQPPPQGYWDGATYLFNSGISPDEAAAKGNGRRAKKDRVSKCISGKVRGEGWDQRRAVAACLNMNREGRLRSDGSYKRKRST